MLLSLDIAVNRAASAPAAPVVPAVPRILAPAHQSVAAPGVAAAVTVYAPGNTGVAIFDGATRLGDAVPQGGGTFAFAWTPSAERVYRLTAAGSVGTSAEALVVVRAATNNVPASVATWTLPAGYTVTTGHADPLGGTGAVKVAATTDLVASNTFFTRNLAPLVTAGTAGVELWVKAEGLTGIAIQNTGGSSASSRLNFATGEGVQSSLASGIDAVLRVVERRADGWCRLWWHRANTTSLANVRLYPLKGDQVGANQSNTCAAGDALYVYGVRVVDAQLPFSFGQKLTFYRVTAVATGVESYRFDHKAVDPGDASVAAQRLHVIKPTGWTSAAAYPVLYVLPALASEAAEIATAFAAVPDTYGCLLVIPAFAQPPWYGCRADGSIDQHRFAAEAMTLCAQECFAGSGSVNDNLVIGYSKSANAAYALILRNPTLFGHAAGWDGFWDASVDQASYPGVLGTADWRDYGQVAAFTTQGNFAAYNPRSLLPAAPAAVRTRKRLTLAGWAYSEDGTTFEDDLAAMKAALEAQAIPFDHDKTERTAGALGGHNWNSGWVPATVATLMAQRSA